MENEQNLRLRELQATLQSDDKQMVLNGLAQIKHDGGPEIIPDLFKLYTSEDSEDIKSEIVKILGSLKNQECASIVVQEIISGDFGDDLPQLIACCWQSQLKYKPYVNTFADLFISGNYLVAVESFTVIEEALMESTQSELNKCKSYLLDKKEEVSPEKKPLYNELIKTLSA